MTGNMQVQEASERETIMFTPVKPEYLDAPPYSSGGFPPPKPIKEDRIGNTTYQSTDLEWVRAHIEDGTFTELVDTGGLEDGEMSFSVKKGVIRGDETLFIIHYWHCGKCHDITVTEKEILILTKVRQAIFAACGGVPNLIPKEDWVQMCKKMYQEAVDRNDVSLNEFYELQLQTQFINMIEKATPAFSPNDLVIENNEVIWYDVASNEIRPLYKQFEPLITNTPGMTARRFKEVIEKMRVRNAGLVRIGNVRETVWYIKPEYCPEFMVTVRTALKGK